VQKETGGNLAESFEGTARLIRSRFRFHRRVRTFTAETRLSSWVLALVPFALYALMSISNPEQAQLMLRDPLGINMIIASLILLIIGNYWIRKLIDLDI
jgi:tight adherence protein B